MLRQNIAGGLHRYLVSKTVSVRPRLPLSRPLCVSSFSRPQVSKYQRKQTSNTRLSLQPCRANHTQVQAQSSVQDSLPPLITDEEAAAFTERALSVWPSPPASSIPPGWSSAWDRWPYLFTLFWHSPYFLMLPQIEMLVNIRYGIPGETRSILFSSNNASDPDLIGTEFIFTMVDRPSEFYLLDIPTLTLHTFPPEVRSEKTLLKHISKPNFAKSAVKENSEGAQAIQRILERDQTVIPFLAENFLDYTPEVTELGDEIPNLPLSGEGEDGMGAEEEAELERIVKKMEDAAEEDLRNSEEEGNTSQAAELENQENEDASPEFEEPLSADEEKEIESLVGEMKQAEGTSGDSAGDADADVAELEKMLDTVQKSLFELNQVSMEFDEVAKKAKKDVEAQAASSA